MSMDLVARYYEVTGSFPRSEPFGLTGQIRRAAGSVPANLAEGHGRQHTRGFLNHIRFAIGSLKELETHLLLSQRVGFLDGKTLAELLELTDRAGRVLAGLRRSLEARLPERPMGGPPPDAPRLRETDSEAG